MDSLRSLIKESLKQEPIGQSKNFVWFITEIGIAAIMNKQAKAITNLDPVKEAIELDLDLSKEEKQLIKIDEKQVILFYS